MSCPPCLRLVRRHPVVTSRGLAVPGGEGEHLVGLVLPVTEDDVSVQVVAARHRRPFVADDRADLPGSLNFSAVAVYCSHTDFMIGPTTWVLERLGQRAVALAHDDVACGGGPLSRVPLLRSWPHCAASGSDVSPGLPPGAGTSGRAFAWSAKRESSGRESFTGTPVDETTSSAAREPVRLLGRQRVAAMLGVARVRRVIVGLAEVDARRVRPAGEGRVGLAGGLQLFLRLRPRAVP